MKRAIFFILIIFNLFVLEVTAGEAVIDINSFKDNIYVGEQTTIMFSVNADENIYGFEIALTYNENLLLPIQTFLTVDELFKDMEKLIVTNKVGNGKIRLVGTLLGEGKNITSRGKLFNFNVKALKEGVTSINISTLKLLNIDGKRIDAIYYPQKISILRKVNYTNPENRVGVRDNAPVAYIKGFADDVDNIEIREVLINNINQENLTLHSKVYEITKSKGQIIKPITIVIPFGEDITNINELGVYYFNEGRKKWLYIGGDVDEEKSVIAVTVDHLTKFAVFRHENFELFYDAKGHWSSRYVNRLQRIGVLKGYQDGSFQPNKAITRSETAILLAKAFDISMHSENLFADDSAIPSWAKESVNAVKEMGLFKGYEDGTFRPNQNISRAELMSSIGSLLPYKESKLVYKDSDDIPHWALKNIEKCSAYGIVSGDDNGYIRPNDFITRAEAATMIYKLLKVLKI